MFYEFLTKDPPDQRNRIPKFHHERKIIMRKRLKLVKSSKSAPSIKAQLVKFEKQICDSHLSEKLFEEKVAVTKIQEDPNYYFRYANKFNIYKTDIGPLLNCSTNSLNNNKYETCCLLVDQFTSFFTTPDPKQIVTDPVSFFAYKPITDISKKKNRYRVNEDIIIEAIHELSPNSATGPDCVPSLLPTNCATELALVLIVAFFFSVSHGVLPASWKRDAVIPNYKSGDKTCLK